MTPDNSSDSGRPQRYVTMLEPVEHIRDMVSRPPTAKESVEFAPHTEKDTIQFHPVLRPPMGVLGIFDDGEESQEKIRVRKSPFVIGRTEGDVVIPHDSQISGRHAEISRRVENQQFKWYLKDLGSTNGTYVRVASVILKHGQSLLLGSRRYRFDASQAAASTSSTTDTPEQGTRQWQQLSHEDLTQLLPALVELTPEGDGRRITITANEHWVGSDSQRSSLVLEDSMVSPRHARIFRDTRDRWCIEHTESLNGLWAQIDEIPLGRGGQFQCGEQRFVFRVFGQ